jgi:hypothetical protein
MPAHRGVVLRWPTPVRIGPAPRAVAPSPPGTWPRTTVPRMTRPPGTVSTAMPALGGPTRPPGNVATNLAGSAALVVAAPPCGTAFEERLAHGSRTAHAVATGPVESTLTCFGTGPRCIPAGSWCEYGSIRCTCTPNAQNCSFWLRASRERALAPMARPRALARGDHRTRPQLGVVRLPESGGAPRRVTRFALKLARRFNCRCRR